MNDGPILVTGAGGFVCSEIAVRLQRAGRDVIAVDRTFDAETLVRLSAVRRIEGPLESVLPDIAALRPAAVIHGAAITASPDRLGLSNAAHIRRNVDLTTAMLDVARDAGAGNFLFLSSMGVFEPSDGPLAGGRFSEATRPTATCTYCAAKRAGELLTEAARDNGFATLSLRLGNTFGPHEAVRETRQLLCLVGRMLAEAGTRGTITVETPEAAREWSWLPDLADGITALMAAFPQGAPPVLHAGTAPVQTDLSVAELIADRSPGVALRVTDPPHAAIRPPMCSDHPGALADVEWTSMAAALDRLMPVGASA